jgi:hypothetical protein
MPAKKLPDTDEERIRALEAVITLEGNEEELSILSVAEMHNLQNSLHAYEKTLDSVQHALNDEICAAKNCVHLFQTAQLYISHFIQVLYLATVRNEVRPENLSFYGLNGNDDFILPDLSTEEAVLEWGERLIIGEAERMSHGGTAIYNPAITKVKVHYDLFREAVHSLKIYRQNTARMRERLEDMRDKVDSVIWTAWTKVEFTCGALSLEDRDRKYREYGIRFYHNSGEQLNVFG